MARELKPCPFCGSNQLSFRSTPDMDTDGKYHRISCNECGASSRATFAMDACPLFFEELRNAWNTRPAPAATDTGLVTVGYAHRGTIGLLLEGAVSKAVIVPNAGGDFKTPVMLVEQAEELLAAERAEKGRLSDDYQAIREQLHRGWRECKDLKADNAAQAARIKAETELREDHQKRNKALEAKLAAAEKALEPFADHAKERAVDAPEWRDTDTVQIVVTIGDLRAARAVLGGKPS